MNVRQKKFVSLEGMTQEVLSGKVNPHCLTHIKNSNEPKILSKITQFGNNFFINRFLSATSQI